MFPIIQRYVDAIITVDDLTIISAMKQIHKRLNQFLEPSGAVCYAAILAYPNLFEGKRVVSILSGSDANRSHYHLLH